MGCVVAIEPTKKPRVVVHGLPTLTPQSVEDMNESEINKRVTAQIKQWMPRIRALAFLYSSRCRDSLYDFDELVERLKICIWLSIMSYNSAAGTKLATWIFGQLKQECSLIIEEQYSYFKGTTVIRMDAVRNDDDPNEEDQAMGLQIKDESAAFDVESLGDIENTNLLSEQVAAVMKTGFEAEVYTLLLNNDPDSTDQAIADQFRVDFAKVAEVRYKAKVALAILIGMKFSKFTEAMNVEEVARRVSKEMHHTIQQWNDLVVPLLPT